MIRAALTATILFLTGISPCCAQTGDVTSLPSYRHQVHLVRVVLDQARSAGDWSLAIPVQKRLESLGRVRLPEGSVLKTDLPELAHELSPSAGSVRSVAGRLDDLDAALESTRSEPVDRATLHELDSILRDSRFHPSCNPLACALQAGSHALLRILRQLSLPSVQLGSSATWGYAIFFLVLVAAVGVLLARGALNRAVVDVTASESAEGEPNRAAEASRRASEYAERGDYRLALRYLFLSTLLTLQDRGLIELRPGFTNREYLRSIPFGGRWAREWRAALEFLVGEFERSWYGHADVSAETYERCRAIARSFEGGAEERAA